MNDQTNPALAGQGTPKELLHYLRDLEHELADAPAEVRDEIVADVRAHVDDSLAAGRSPQQVISALGTVAEQADQYRTALGIESGSAADPRRGALLLHSASVIVGVLTGCLAAFIVPLDAMPFESTAATASDLSVQTLLESRGLAASLLTFVPVLLALLPIILPARAQAPVAIANAVIVAALAAITFESVGMLYVPLAVLMWAAAVVPWRVLHGLNIETSKLWRLFGGVLLAMPGLLLAGGLMTGTFLIDTASLRFVIGAIVIGALFGIGMRAIYILTAILGIVIMVLAMVFLGYVTVAVWWVGGLYLAVGLSAIATLQPRRTARVVS